MTWSQWHAGKSQGREPWGKGHKRQKPVKWQEDQSRTVGFDGKKIKLEGDGDGFSGSAASGSDAGAKQEKQFQVLKQFMKDFSQNQVP